MNPEPRRGPPAGFLAATVLLAGTALAWLLWARGNGACGPAQLLPGVLLAVAAGMGIVAAAAQGRAIRRLDQERARTQALLDAQRAMFHELQHRVANNMQFVGSLLALQARRTPDATAREALNAATRRLELLARIHRRLHDPDSAARDFGQTVEEICHDLLAATDARNIVCRVDMQDTALGLDRLATLSMIITELLTNAVKHAFTDGRDGTIAISLRAIAAGRYALEVRDNGSGPPPSFDPARSVTLGLRIIQSLAKRLEGTLSMSAEDGMVTRIEFTGDTPLRS